MKSGSREGPMVSTLALLLCDFFFFMNFVLAHVLAVKQNCHSSSGPQIYIPVFRGKKEHICHRRMNIST